MEDLFFHYNTDYKLYSNVASNKAVLLSHIIGDTLSNMIRRKECPLELIRLNFEGYTCVVRRRWETIKVEFYEKRK